LTARIFLKLIAGMLVVLAVALAAVDYLARTVAENAYTETLTRDMREKARVIASAIPAGEADPSLLLRGLAKAANARVTYIAHDGTVIFDSEAAPEKMENHASRPEIRTALAGQDGADARMSASVGIRYEYVAVPVRGGALRLAVPLSVIEGHVTGITRELLVAVVLAFLPAFGVAALLARYVSHRLGSIIGYAGQLARGDFDSHLVLNHRDELGILAEQLNTTGTKLKQTFDELEQEHQKLERVERIRRDFVINVSHELRTPLASIQGYTETLLDGALHDSEHNMRFLQIIRQNAERLGRLIADLMTLSQIELKRTKFQFAAYDMNQMMQECVDALAPLAEKKNITLNLEWAPEGTDVFCDSEAVHQILANLLDNAIKYTPEGGRIEVGAARQAGNGQRVEIFVRDNGPGIPAEELPRLFERFYRVDKARSRELGGTGLGLAIVKHLVQAQGGEVRVASEVQKGSTFAFTLPIEDLGLVEYSSVQAELTNL
jgi:two-component system, OmpR family, phosphate regulon sensor histidine kinase PhoR